MKRILALVFAAALLLVSVGSASANCCPIDFDEFSHGTILAHQIEGVTLYAIDGHRQPEFTVTRYDEADLSQYDLNAPLLWDFEDGRGNVLGVSEFVIPSPSVNPEWTGGFLNAFLDQEYIGARITIEGAGGGWIAFRTDYVNQEVFHIPEGQNETVITYYGSFNQIAGSAEGPYYITDIEFCIGTEPTSVGLSRVEAGSEEISWQATLIIIAFLVFQAFFLYIRRKD